MRLHEVRRHLQLIRPAYENACWSSSRLWRRRRVSWPVAVAASHASLGSHFPEGACGVASRAPQLCMVCTLLSCKWRVLAILAVAGPLPVGQLPVGQALDITSRRSSATMLEHTSAW